MIVNFYRTTRGNRVNPTLLITKNIDCIPGVETFITYSGQRFQVYDVYFDIDTCEYNIYIARI